YWLREIKDVTDFLDEHPGGSGYIMEYAGQDITDILAAEATHLHSESTYEILDENYHIGYLATEEEKLEDIRRQGVVLSCLVYRHGNG
ncbi:hypothetical protein WICPIJ_007795, partial [Wickerhamomyces pijperi]